MNSSAEHHEIKPDLIESDNVPTEQELFQQLDVELAKYKFKPLVHKIENKRNLNPTVVILGYVELNLGVIEEAYHISPGNFLLAFSPDWLVSIPIAGTNHHKIMVKKGIYFDEEMNCTFVEFVYPRVVDYFINYYTMGSFSDLHGKFSDEDRRILYSALALERNFEGAMGNSSWLAKEINDKLLTRVLIHQKGGNIPFFFGFVTEIPLKKQAILQQFINEGNIIILPSQNIQRKILFEKALDNFERKYPQYEEVVVKPSGIKFCGGEGVKFFNIKDRKEIINHICYLFENYHMGSDDAVLVDSRLHTPPIFRGEKKCDWNLRVFVSRNTVNEGEFTGMLGRIGGWSRPTNCCIDASCITYEDLTKEWGISDEISKELYLKIKDISAKSFAAIRDYEQFKRYRELDEPKNAQTDMIGLDVMIEMRNNSFEPVVIEVNDHEAGGQSILDDLDPSKKGESVRSWMNTMMFRAKEYKRKRELFSKTIRRVQSCEIKSPKKPTSPSISRFGNTNDNNSDNNNREDRENDNTEDNDNDNNSHMKNGKSVNSPVVPTKRFFTPTLSRLSKRIVKSASLKVN